LQTPVPPETLTGLLERVTFFNEENGFAVLKVKVQGRREEVTIVGSLPSANPGEWVTAEGRWVREREFGLQFKADLLTSIPPTSREGIEKYLGSGLVKGIGPVYAQQLVERLARNLRHHRNTARHGQEVDGSAQAARRHHKGVGERRLSARYG